MATAGFEQLFHSDCNMDGTYKGVDGWVGGGGGEWEAEDGLSVPLRLIQQQCVYSK